MKRKYVLAGMLLTLASATVAFADDRPATPPAQETGGGVLAVGRTVALFPFKGVVCVVGALASFPVYWLSGLDPQVETDTEALQATYCSPDYLFGPEWKK
jgi:hypothetical protein